MNCRSNKINCMLVFNSIFVRNVFFRFRFKIIEIGLEILFYLASTCLPEHVEEQATMVSIPNFWQFWSYLPLWYPFNEYC